MESKTTIEVNGRTYDAITGAVVGSAQTAPVLRKTGRNIDGFFRPRTVITPTLKAPESVDNSIAALADTAPSAPQLTSRRTVNHARAHTPQPAKARRDIPVTHHKTESHALFVKRSGVNHVKHHVAQHSTTLRRDVVPAPSTSTHNLLRPVGALQHSRPRGIEIKNPASSIDQERLARAQEAEKSSLISRHQEIAPTVAPIFNQASVHTAPQPAKPAATPGAAGNVPSTPPPKLSNRPIDIFEHALANANNFVDIHEHRKLYVKRARTHVASMAVGSLALIVIASFIAYQNNPSLQFKIATIKAGVSATMPNLAAAGFKFNGVKAGDGKLTIGLHSDTTNGDFQLTQANTNLSDSDMIQTIGATNSSGEPTYSTVNANGTKVYRFSNTNATWVSDGEWYTVDGNTALTNNQLRSLVQNI